MSPLSVVLKIPLEPATKPISSVANEISLMVSDKTGDQVCPPSLVYINSVSVLIKPTFSSTK